MSSDNLNISELLKQIPVGEIAAKLGIDEETATRAAEQALPGLLGGLAVNASSEEGAEKLTSALKQHEDAEFVGVDDAHTEEGKKIVKHVLGDKEQDVAMALAGQGQGGLGDIIQKMLPMLAPIVMAFLAKQFLGGGSAAKSGESAQAGGGIGDLLGGLLGGAGSGTAASGSAGGLGDILGGLLGGASGGKQSGGLGGLLGGLLGGGK